MEDTEIDYESKVKSFEGPHQSKPIRMTRYYSEPTGSIRIAECTQCGMPTFSNPYLPHFEKSNGNKDSFYCGCWGWD